VTLRLDHLQQREEHWAAVDPLGKGGHIRTVPVPDWVRNELNDWLIAAAIDSWIVAWSTSELAGDLGALALFIAGWTMPAQSVITFCARRGLLSVHRRWLRPTRSPSHQSDPLHRRLQRLCCLHRRSDCFRAERISSRAGLSPAVDQRVFTAHMRLVLGLMMSRHSLTESLQVFK